MNNEMNVKNSFSPNRSNESGAAVIVAIFFLLFVAVVVTASVVSRVREGRAREMSQTQLEEMWQARSAAAVLTRVIKVRLPEIYLQDVALAKDCAGVNANLEAFESQNLSDESFPAARVSPSTGTIECGDSGEGSTSLLGDVGTYLAARQVYLAEQSSALGFPPDQARIFSLDEAVRRFSSAAEPSYQIHFIVDGRGGRYGQTRVEDDVILGNLSSNCGTTAAMKADRDPVAAGESVTFTITYSMATHLKVYETAGGTIVHKADVTEDPNPQTYTFTFTPASANSYFVKATGSTAGCASQSGAVVVGVTRSGGCAVNPPTVPVFSASSAQANPSEEIILQWQTGGGTSQVTLNGLPVNPANTDYRVIVGSDTTFTLIAADNDPNSDCPAQKSVTVRVSAPSCVLQTPTVAFSSDNTSVSTGQSFNLSWNVGGLDASRQILFTEPDGTTHSSAASGADRRVLNTAGIYIYKIAGTNKCPDGTLITTEKIVSVTVSDNCPPPAVNSFTANPASVYAGGSQSVRFEWSLGGTIEAVTISDAGSVAGRSFIFIPQPQTTSTYTLTAAGCEQSKTAQVTVTVGSPPPAGSRSLRLLTYTVDSYESNPDPGNDTCRVDYRSYGISSTPSYIDNGNGTITVRTTYPTGVNFNFNQANFTSFDYSWSLIDADTGAVLQTGSLPFPDNTQTGEFTMSEFGRPASQLRLKMNLTYDNSVFGANSSNCSGEQYNYQVNFAF